MIHHMNYHGACTMYVHLKRIHSFLQVLDIVLYECLRLRWFIFIYYVITDFFCLIVLLIAKKGALNLHLIMVDFCFSIQFHQFLCILKLLSGNMHIMIVTSDFYIFMCVCIPIIKDLFKLNTEHKPSFYISDILTRPYEIPVSGNAIHFEVIFI